MPIPVIDVPAEYGKRYAAHVSRQWRSFFHSCRRVSIANLNLGPSFSVTSSTTANTRTNLSSALHGETDGGLSNGFYYSGYSGYDIGGLGSGISASWAVVEDDTADTANSGLAGGGGDIHTLATDGNAILSSTATDSTATTATSNTLNSTLDTTTQASPGGRSAGQGQGRTMTTNPSHILIARGSRGHNPSAALSSPTETHAAASGIFRNEHNRDPRARRLHHHSSSSRSQTHSQTQANAVNLGVSTSGSGVTGGGAYGHGIGGTMSGQWVIEESEADSEREGDDMSDAPTEDVELDPTFTREGRFPGTVKIVVEGTTFW